MKLLFDYFPLILFFAIFKLAGANPDVAVTFANHYFSSWVSGGVIGASQAPITLATVATIIATALQIMYLLARKKKVDAMMWLVLAIITVFGGATIYFNNDTFIKWKPTVFYWTAALAFLIGNVVFKKNFTRALIDKFFVAPDAVWNKLNLAWVIFFGLLGMLNLYVAFNFTLDQWVSFKVFGATGLTFAFVMGQSVFLMKYMKDDAA
jgi:intracellular septation protein